MITLRRAEERHYDRHHKAEDWLTFFPRDRADPRADHFGPLKSLNERRLPPGAIASRTPHHEAEIVTYVREGALAYEDAPGRSGVIQAGEFQGTTAGRGIRRSEKNASRSNWARRSRGSSQAMNRNASVWRSAVGGYASSPRPTHGEDRCASTRTL
jgi:redox-sensitive bicupin YhaK (pirin superfamily)